MNKGYYYLHENGELIYKRDLPGIIADFRESTFVRMFWSIDTDDRQSAWDFLVEAGTCDVNMDRVNELATKWGCSDEDAETYADRAGVILSKDGDQWCATRKDFTNLQESPAGFGDTALIAFTALCKELGYKPRKLWGESFSDLLSKHLPPTAHARG